MGDTLEEELSQNLSGKSEAEVYQNMYQSLFRDISKVLTTLETRDIESFGDVIKMLEDAQCRAEEIFLNTEQTSQKNNLYANIYKRTNLQAIGYFIREGSVLEEKKNTSFTERELKAEKELEEALNELLDEKVISKLYPIIIKYVAVKEEIQFSVGMKAGAKIVLLLTNDSDYDF